MLSKETKIRVLESFYGLDYVFFGKPVNKLETCCPVVKEDYVTVKGALLSVFIEMLKLMEHKPEKVNEKLDSRAIYEAARENAELTRENVRKIVESEKAKQNIKEDVKRTLESDESLDVQKIVKEKITEKSFRLAVDNFLVARALTESKNISNLNEWTGQLIEDSYKILRDSLVENAMLLLDDVE